MNVLTHHNGIVHQDPQDQDKPKQGDDINRQAQNKCREDRAQKRHGDANAHPKCQPWLQEQGKQYQHHQKSLASTVEQGLETILQGF